jgi:hypothetical protein
VIVGIVLLAFLGLRFIAANTATEPLAFDMPAVAPGVAVRVENRLKQFEEGDTLEGTFTAEELNGLAQKAVEKYRKYVGQDVDARARIDLEPDGKTRLLVTLPLALPVVGTKIPFLGTRYWNVDFLGTLGVENGAIVVSDVERAVIGREELRGADAASALKENLTSLVDVLEKAGSDAAEGFDRIERLRNEGGRLTLKVKPPEKRSPPEK